MNGPQLSCFDKPVLSQPKGSARMGFGLLMRLLEDPACWDENVLLTDLFAILRQKTGNPMRSNKMKFGINLGGGGICPTSLGKQPWKAV